MLDPTSVKIYRQPSNHRRDISRDTSIDADGAHWTNANRPKNDFIKSNHGKASVELNLKLPRLGPGSSSSSHPSVRSHGRVLKDEAAEERRHFGTNSIDDDFLKNDFGSIAEDFMEKLKQTESIASENAREFAGTAAKTESLENVIIPKIPGIDFGSSDSSHRGYVNDFDVHPNSAAPTENNPTANNVPNENAGKVELNYFNRIKDSPGAAKIISQIGSENNALIGLNNGQRNAKVNLENEMPNGRTEKLCQNFGPCEAAAAADKQLNELMQLHNKLSQYFPFSNEYTGTTAAGATTRPQLNPYDDVLTRLTALKLELLRQPDMSADAEQIIDYLVNGARQPTSFGTNNWSNRLDIVNLLLDCARGKLLPSSSVDTTSSANVGNGNFIEHPGQVLAHGTTFPLKFGQSKIDAGGLAYGLGSVESNSNLLDRNDIWKMFWIFMSAFAPSKSVGSEKDRSLEGGKVDIESINPSNWNFIDEDKTNSAFENNPISLNVDGIDDTLKGLRRIARDEEHEVDEKKENSTDDKMKLEESYDRKSLDEDFIKPELDGVEKELDKVREKLEKLKVTTFRPIPPLPSIFSSATAIETTTPTSTTVVSHQSSPTEMITPTKIDTTSSGISETMPEILSTTVATSKATTATPETSTTRTTTISSTTCSAPTTITESTTTTLRKSPRPTTRITTTTLDWREEAARTSTTSTTTTTATSTLTTLTAPLPPPPPPPPAPVQPPPPPPSAPVQPPPAQPPPRQKPKCDIWDYKIDFIFDIFGISDSDESSDCE